MSTLDDNPIGAYHFPRMRLRPSGTALMSATAGLCLAVGVGLTLDARPASPPARNTGAHAALVDQYCLSCHDEAEKKGDLALDMAVAQDVSQHPDLWEKVVRKLRARQMPPVGKDRPGEAAYDAAIASLEASLDRAARDKPNPGRTATIRRLTRTEYQNAIRDLLAVDVDVTALLPADESSYGFDNVTVGDLSPTLLDRYISAAEKISRLAVGGPSRSPGGDTIRIRRGPHAGRASRRAADWHARRRGGAVYVSARRRVRISVRLMRDRDEHVEGLFDTHDVDVLLDRARVQLFTVKPPRTEPEHAIADQHLKIRTSVRAGQHTIGVAFLKKPSVLIETARQPYQARFNYYRHPRAQPAIYSVSVLGPYGASAPGDTASRRRIFVSRPAGAAQEDRSARQILSALMRRAYRRPVTNADLQGPLAVYRKARADSGFEGGIEMAVSAVLVSPNFLFRVEQDPAGVRPDASYRIGDLDLASRLSFFLWSSIPDDQLLDAAVAGTLHQPAVLERQVRRMLADPRARALVNNFAAQWLHLRNLASITPDMRLFPDFDDNLRQRLYRRRPSSSSTVCCARIAACSICCARTTRSSTSAWRSTTASRTSTAASSAASPSRKAASAAACCARAAS